MNQADKEYLQKKGLLRKDETAVDWAIQEAAMKEAVIFAGALLEKGNGVMELQTISLYLDDLLQKDISCMYICMYSMYSETADRQGTGSIWMWHHFMKRCCFYMLLILFFIWECL